MNVLVSWLVAGVGVALVATLASRTIPSGSPAARHGFWWLVLAAVLAVPFVPDLLGVLTPHGTDATAATAIGSPADAMLTIPAPPEWCPAAALTVWALTALVAASRLIVNLRAVRRLSRHARPLSADRVGRFQQFAEARLGSRHARVYVTDELRGACAVGFTNPRILISSDLVATLDDDAIEAIVLHEYAHLQRYDDWTRLVQQVAKAVAGIHPAVRWVCRQIDVEREAACDRIVVARTGAPVVYGKALAAAAEIASRMSGLTPVAAPGVSISESGLHARIRRLLDARQVKPAVLWASTGASAAALAVSTAAAASLPPLVAIASLERPLLEMASVPFDAARVQLLPTTATPQRPEALLDRFAVSAPHEQPVRLTAATEGQATPGPEDVAPTTAVHDAVPLAHDAVPAPRADVAPTPAPADVPLASTPLSRAFAAPGLDTTSKDEPADGEGIGESAARFGVKTGDAASRAGNSIGRFFKRRGLAIANSF
jgi:beta-lactamase regulating signal transducer with metallopeptidase domain